MNTTSLSLCALALLTLTAFDAGAQCRKFTKQRVISTLDAGQAIDQIQAGTLGRGESAAAVLEVSASGTVDLLISTHPDLGEVTFNVVSASGRSLAEGTIAGTVTTLPLQVEAAEDLIVHVTSEKASGAYTPIGCVSLVTTQPITEDVIAQSRQ